MATDTLRLTGVQIENFGCFADSGAVPIEDVTVLLAENENGKTTFLRALEWFGGNEDFDEEDRYTGAPDSAQTAVILDFEVHEAARAALTEAGFSPSQKVRVRRDDSGLFTVVDEKGAPMTRRADAPELDKLPANISAARDQLRSALEAVRGANPSLVDQAMSLLDDLTPATDLAQLANLIQQQVVPQLGAPQVGSTYAALSAAYAAFQSEPSDAARAWDVLREFAPTFIYLDDLTDFLFDEVTYAEVQTDPRRYRAMANMAKIVGVDLSGIASRPRHERQRSSKRAEAILSDEASRFWNGDQIGFHITLEETAMVVSIEHRGRAQKPSRRSRGMQWFLGFFINFKAETNDELEGAVLLIDEPGLHLHLQQQPKLLEFFDEIAKSNQVIYTTHLPQMIPRGRIERLRLFVADPRFPGAVRVESKPHALRTTEDVLAPVRAAIGIGLFEPISLGNHSVIVEGVVDYIFMHALSEACRAANKDALRDEVSIIPAVGAGSKMLPVAAVAFGRSTRSAAVVDDDTAGVQAEKEIDERFEGLFPVVRVKNGAKSTGGMIEDLFDREFYAGLVCDAYERLNIKGFKRFTAADLDSSKPITKAIEAHFKANKLGSFAKLQPALELRKRLDLGDPVDPIALENFGDLFKQINAALDEKTSTAPRRK